MKIALQSLSSHLICFSVAKLVSTNICEAECYEGFEQPMTLEEARVQNVENKEIFAKVLGELHCTDLVTCLRNKRANNNIFMSHCDPAETQKTKEFDQWVSREKA